MSKISPLSAIHSKAIIGKNTEVGPFSVIEGDVVIGDNCWIGSNVVIMDGARIGNNCKIFPGAVISGIPQDLKYKGEPTQFIIGNNVIIRECCTLNRGTSAAGKSQIGDNCLIMAYVHIAHDCIIENNCVLANNVTLAGHINIGKFATLGGLTAVHQFVQIGEQVMVGGGSLVRQDIPPFITAARNPLSYAGINTVGLSRRGFSKTDMHHIEDIYRLLFVRGMNTTNALAAIAEQIPSTSYREQILKFVHCMKRVFIDI